VDEVTRIEVQPAAPDRTPQEGPVEERSIAATALSDLNGILVAGGGTVLGVAALNVVNKFRDKGGPPSGGPAGGQDPAPPPKAD